MTIFNAKDIWFTMTIFNAKDIGFTMTSHYVGTENLSSVEEMHCRIVRVLFF